MFHPKFARCVRVDFTDATQGTGLIKWTQAFFKKEQRAVGLLDVIAYIDYTFIVKCSKDNSWNIHFTLFSNNFTSSLSFLFLLELLRCKPSAWISYEVHCGSHLGMGLRGCKDPYGTTPCIKFGPYPTLRTLHPWPTSLTTSYKRKKIDTPSNDLVHLDRCQTLGSWLSGGLGFDDQFGLVIGMWFLQWD